jgi:chemotaxis protein methyltransferase CheR
MNVSAPFLYSSGKRTDLVAAAPADNNLLTHEEISDDELAEIGSILSMWRSINIAAYKDKYMKRRVAIRMRSTRCRDAGQYCNLLRQSPQELDLLQKALTIHVSQFYRNPSMFDKLRDEVFPGLFQQSRTNGSGTLRLWCLGCAGGEEPYSLAILLREYFSKELRTVQTVINATDIDAATLRSAQQAEYTAERLKDVPTEHKDRYFRQHGHLFRLVPEIREMVNFLQSDITHTSGHIPSDLVVCRNTLIYFTRPDQGKILHGVADILPEGGILVLGKSETLVGDVRRRFEAVCPVERIYRKR